MARFAQFGSLFRGMREARGLSQSEVVLLVGKRTVLVGMALSAYSRWEKGTRTPTPPQLAAVLRVLEPLEEDWKELWRELQAASAYASAPEDLPTFLDWAEAQPQRPARGSWRDDL